MSLRLRRPTRERTHRFGSGAAAASTTKATVTSRTARSESICASGGWMGAQHQPPSYIILYDNSPPLSIPLRHSISPFPAILLSSYPGSLPGPQFILDSIDYSPLQQRQPCCRDRSSHLAVRNLVLNSTRPSLQQERPTDNRPFDQAPPAKYPAIPLLFGVSRSTRHMR